MNRPNWLWIGPVVLFLSAVWIMLAPTWIGYPLRASDWITAAVLAGSSLGLGFWSLTLATNRPQRGREGYSSKRP
jgi:hypothetical protein